MSAISLDHVTKRFGSHVAVNDLSLDVPDGYSGYVVPWVKVEIVDETTIRYSWSKPNAYSFRRLKT